MSEENIIPDASDIKNITIIQLPYTKILEKIVNRIKKIACNSGNFLEIDEFDNLLNGYDDKKNMLQKIKRDFKRKNYIVEYIEGMVFEGQDWEDPNGSCPSSIIIIWGDYDE